MYKFKKPNRKVTEVIIHCSAASRANVTAKEIDQWHRQRGFAGIGYNYFIRTDGTLEVGRSLERSGAHTKGHNRRSIGICLNGLHPQDFTQAQFKTLNDLVTQINEAYNGELTFHGHKEFANKACPVFDYKLVMGINERHKIDQAGDTRTPVSLKPLTKSKEMIAGGTAVCSGAAAVVGATSGAAQTILVAGLVVAVLGVGAFIMWNRLKARKNKER